MTLVLTASFGTGSSVGCLYDEDHMELESALMASDIWMQTDSVTGSNGKRKHWPEQELEQLKRTRTEDTDCTPRRRVPLMWCPRMRWKDERRKVLKMSVNKLRRIDDPESYLRRSVLINNTVRKLQAEIRQERCTHPTNSTSPKSKSWGFDSQPPEDEYPGRSRSLESKEDSCDEIFGIHEDFLRITIPDRCSPTPEVHNNNNNNSNNNNKGSSVTTRSCTRNRTSSGNQCATQYRTVQDFLANDSRQVSHFDNVVYHSLLASLES